MTIRAPSLKTRFKDAHDWLTSHEPVSVRQAQAVSVYLAFHRLIANPLALSGFIILAAFVFIAFAAPALAPYPPEMQNLADRFRPPDSVHWLGTDEFGRDILSRILYGSQTTFMIVIVVSLTAAPIGLIVGCAAGYFGGWVETITMRITDVFLAFPRLVLALALVSVMGPGVKNAVIALALTSWAPYARISRTEVLSVRNSEFISAARLQGFSSLRIIFGQLVDIAMPAVIVRATLDMAVFLLAAAGLGFLGLGAQPPMPEWGAMVAEGRRHIADYWWVTTFPGLAILIVCLAFNLLGDGLRDVLDPRG